MTAHLETASSTRKAAIVTGAASGIGLGVARRLLNDGYELVMVDRDGESLQRARTELQAEGSAHGVVGDLSVTASARTAIDAALDLLPHASALVSCAGVLRLGTLQELPMEAWDELFGVHARAPVVLAQQFIKHSKEHALSNPHRHRIVAISSTAAVIPRTGNGAYSASKSALNMAYRVLAAETAPLGFNVNIVTPGLTNTPMARGGADPTVDWQPSGTPPIGRMAEPEDIAGAVSFFCSPDAAFISGANLVVDGAGTAALRGA